MKEPRRNKSENIHKEVAKVDIFAELYEQSMPRVYRYVYYKVNNVHLAEDLTSSLFENAIISSTWLFAIAHNTIIDHFRTSTRGELVPLNDTNITSKDSSPEDEAEEQDKKRDLNDYIISLPMREQEDFRQVTLTLKGKIGALL